MTKNEFLIKIGKNEEEFNKLISIYKNVNNTMRFS